MAIHDAYRATINGTGDTADQTMTVGVEAAHADQDGNQFRAIGLSTAATAFTSTPPGCAAWPPRASMPPTG